MSLSEGRIEGEFAQLGNRGTFWLQRPGSEPSAPDDDIGSAYRSAEVVISSGGFVLSGEVMLPDGDGPHPAVVLINGSGDQDRDATVAGFRMFADLAEHLAEQGVASLRYDDRGVGGSTGAGLLTTLGNRADDVEAALALLQSRHDVDADRVGLIGHSEGGYIAPIVANRADGVDFVILLASPAVPGDELLRVQLPAILTASGASPEVFEREQGLQHLVLEAIATGDGWDGAEAGFRAWAGQLLESMSAQERDSIPDEEVFVDVVVADKMAEAQSPWFRSVVEHDPRPDIVSLDIPLLALFAELDPLVPLDLNAEALLDAIAVSAVPSHELATIAGANHLFQEAVTGSPDEYGDLALAFAPEFLQRLAEWLTDHLKS